MLVTEAIVQDIAIQYCAHGFAEKHTLITEKSGMQYTGSSHRRATPKLLDEDNPQVTQPDPMLDL